MTYVKTPHKHAAMIKAKADNTELAVFTKSTVTNKWEATSFEDLVKNEDFDFFLCLPKHNENGQCLHWLNGGEVQYENQRCQGGWGSVSSVQDSIEEKADDMECSIDELSDFNPCEWSCESIFMKSVFCLRIKPRKEKRWIAVRSGSSYVIPRHYETKEEAEKDAASLMMGEFQYKEIEVEV